MTLTNFLKYDYNKLVNYTRKRLGDVLSTIDPEDIVHDVALNVYSKADVNYPIENLAGYIYRSIRNRITDYQRKNSSTVKKVSNSMDYEHIDVSDDGPSELEEAKKRDQLKDQVMGALDKLNPEQRLIIIKTEFEGLSFNQLSEELGSPIGTLLARKHRAVANLKKIMNESKNH